MTPEPVLSFKAYPARHGRLFYRVAIFKNKADLRTYCKQCNPPIKGKTLGACRSFEKPIGQQLGEILFSRRQLMVTVVTHECLHAALGWFRWRMFSLTTMLDEERLAHAQSNLVRTLYNRIYDAGLLFEAKNG